MRAFRSGTWIPACFALFLLLRLTLILLVPVAPKSDAVQYFRLAEALGNGLGYIEHGMPSAYWPVGYPAFLGGLFALFGPRTLVGQLGNLALAAVSFFLVLSLTRRIFRSETTARIAVLILALYPNNIAYASLLMTETWFTFLVLAGCWCFMFGRGRWALVLAGVIFGLATLTKPQTLVLPLALIVLSLMDRAGRRDLRRQLINAAVLYLALLATVLPWTARNYVALGAPVFVSTNGGVNLLIGNNPSATGGYMEEDALLAERGFTLADQVAADRRAKALAREWIAEHPRRALELMPHKALLLWAWDGEADWAYRVGYADYPGAAGGFLAARVLNQVFYFAIIALFLLSMVMLPRQLAQLTRPWVFFGYLFAIYTTLIALVVFGAPRFHFPVMPWIIMYASWVIAEWLLRDPAGQAAQSAAPTAPVGSAGVAP